MGFFKKKPTARLRFECPGCKAEVPGRLKAIAAGDFCCDQCGTIFIAGQNFMPMDEVSGGLMSLAWQVHQQEPPFAIEILENILDVEEWNAEANNLMGIILDEAKDRKKALGYLQRAVELDPKVSRYHYDLGVAYTYDEEYRKAADAFQEALEIFPVYLHALSNLTHCFLSMGEVIAAAIVADRVATLDIAGPLGNHSRTVIQKMCDSNIPEFELELTCVKSIMYAFQLQQQGNMEEAAKYFEKLLEIIPKTLPGYYMVCEYYASCLLVLDRHGESLAYSDIAYEGLPCVGALVEPPVPKLFEAGQFKDIQRFYEDTIKEIAGAESASSYFLMDGPFHSHKKCMVLTDKGKFSVSRAGNILRITREEDGRSSEKVLYEDTPFSTDNI
jgi:tetratricopeptide (TPR) repeat protein